MISQEEFASRRKKLIEHMGHESLAIIPAAHEKIRSGDTEYLFRQNSDFYYLTGFNEQDAIAVIIPHRAEGQYILFTLPKDPQAETWTGKRVGQEKAKAEYKADQAYTLAQLNEIMPELLKNRRRVFCPIGKDAAFDQKLKGWIKHLRVKMRSGVIAPSEFIMLEDFVHEMRLRKSFAEIEVMKKAAEISALAHVRAMSACQPGRMEYQLEADLLYVFAQHNCYPPAYNCIVAGGANACTLHYVENASQLKSGDLVLIDAAGEYQNYAADVTRTFPINGIFSKEQKTLYQIVLQTQKAVIKLIKPGILWSELQDLAIQMLTEGLIKIDIIKGKLDSAVKEKLYLPFYMHNIGHWLGLDVHDPSSYRVGKAWRPLEPGMVFTVEPGLYIKPQENVDKKWWNIGIRIEDDILVTSSGSEILSKNVPKEIDEIEELLSGKRQVKI